MTSNSVLKILRQTYFRDGWVGGVNWFAASLINIHDIDYLEEKYITKTTKDLFATRNIRQDEAITNLAKNFSPANKSWFAIITFFLRGVKKHNDDQHSQRYNLVFLQIVDIKHLDKGYPLLPLIWFLSVTSMFFLNLSIFANGLYHKINGLKTGPTGLKNKNNPLKMIKCMIYIFIDLQL